MESSAVDRGEKFGGAESYLEKRIAFALAREVLPPDRRALGPYDETSSLEDSIQHRDRGQVLALSDHRLEEGPKFGPQAEEKGKALFGPRIAAVAMQSVPSAGHAPPKLHSGEIPEEIETEALP